MPNTWWSEWTQKSEGSMLSPLGSVFGLFMLMVILFFSSGYFKRKQSATNAWHLLLTFDGVLVDRKQKTLQAIQGISLLAGLAKCDHRPTRIRGGAALSLLVDHAETSFPEFEISPKLLSILDVSQQYTTFMRSHLTLLLAAIYMRHDVRAHKVSTSVMDAISPMLLESSNQFAQYMAVLAIAEMVRHVNLAVHAVNSGVLNSLIQLGMESKSFHAVHFPIAACLVRLTRSNVLPAATAQPTEKEKTKEGEKPHLPSIHELIIKLLFQLSRRRDATVRMATAHVLGNLSTDKRLQDLMMVKRCDKLVALLNNSPLAATHFHCSRAFSQLPGRDLPDPTDETFINLLSISSAEEMFSDNTPSGSDSRPANKKEEKEKEKEKDDEPPPLTPLSRKAAALRKIAKYFVSESDPIRELSQRYRRTGRETSYRMLLESERLLDIELMIRIVELSSSVFPRFIMALQVQEQLVLQGRFELRNDAASTGTETLRKRGGETAAPAKPDHMPLLKRQSAQLREVRELVQHQVTWAKEANKFAVKLITGLDPSHQYLKEIQRKNKRSGAPATPSGNNPPTTTEASVKQDEEEEVTSETGDDTESGDSEDSASDGDAQETADGKQEAK